MSTSIIQSSPKWIKITNGVPSLLKALGVDHRPGHSFWANNRMQLPELYRELQEAVRDRIKILHPDHGGDEESFKELIVEWRKAQKIFRRYLPVTALVENTIKFYPAGQSPEEKHRARSLKYYNKAKQNPAYRATALARATEWNKTHNKRRREIHNDWKKRNPEKVIADHRRDYLAKKARQQKEKILLTAA